MAALTAERVGEGGAEGSVELVVAGGGRRVLS